MIATLLVLACAGDSERTESASCGELADAPPAPGAVVRGNYEGINLGTNLLIADLSERAGPDLVAAGPNSPESAHGAVNGARVVIAEPTTRLASKAPVILRESGATTGLGALMAGGDVDGDGHDDLLVSAWVGDLVGGETYLYLGPIAEGTRRADADATIVGDSGAFAVFPAVLGDLDGSGSTWVGIGAPRTHVLVQNVPGTVHLFRGAELSGRVDLLESTVTITAEAARDGLGFDMVGGADRDGDGMTDLVLPTMDAVEPSLHILSGPLNLGADIVPSDGERALVGDFYTTYYATGGDLDGDGIEDLVLGQPLAQTEAGERAGRVLVAPGSLPPGETPLDALAIALDGESAYDGLGRGVARAGDVDGDGHDDLAVGAPGDPYFGEVRPGRVMLFAGPLRGRLAEADAIAVLSGDCMGEGFGWSIASEDLDGDGASDVAVGAPWSSTAAPLGGRVAVFFSTDL